jgi:hypothetical protein
LSRRELRLTGQRTKEPVNVGPPPVIAQRDGLAVSERRELEQQGFSVGHDRVTDENGEDALVLSQCRRHLSADVVVGVGETRHFGRSIIEPPRSDHRQHDIRLRQRGFDRGGKALPSDYGDDVLEYGVAPETRHQVVPEAARPRRGVGPRITQEDTRRCHLQLRLALPWSDARS